MQLKDLPLPQLMGVTTLPDAYHQAVLQAHQRAMMPLEEHLKAVASKYAEQKAMADIASTQQGTAYKQFLQQFKPMQLREMMRGHDIQQGTLDLRKDPMYRLMQEYGRYTPEQKTAFAASHPEIVQQMSQYLQNLANQAGSPGINPQQQKEADENTMYGFKEAANHKITGPQVRRQFDAAIALHSFLNNPHVDKLMQSTSDYGGAIGKGKEFLDKWLKDPKNEEKYRDYFEFQNFLAGNLENFTRQMEGMGVQQETSRKLENMFKSAVNSASSNPARTLDYFNRVRQELADIGKSRSEAAQPAFPGLREKKLGINWKLKPIKFSNKNESGPTKEGALEALRKRGIKL